MAEPTPPDLTAAPDVPPENNFDPAEFANAFIGAAQKAGWVAASVDATSTAHAKAAVDFLTWLLAKLPAEIQLALKGIEIAAEDFLKVVLAVALAILKPVKDIFGDLTKAYVASIAEEQGTVSAGSGLDPTPHLHGAAADAFDRILKPIGFLGGSTDPSQPGAGEAAAQFVLGSLVNIHLATWVVNVVSNLSGIGALKFINSFDEVILAAMNTRSMGRVAFRPYLDTFMANPTKRDLNVKFPLDDTGPTAIVKSYVRGAITREAMLNSLREKGFAQDVAMQILADSTRELTVPEVAYLVNHALWTDEQATTYLEQIGYSAAISNVPLGIAKAAHVDTIHKAAADDLVAALRAKKISTDDARLLLRAYGFTDAEVGAYLNRGALNESIKRNLTESQVKALFLQNLVDLTYVQNYLESEGYSHQDAQLLILLDFTEKDQIEARKGQIAGQLRVQAVALEEQAASELAKGDQRLATAKQTLADKKLARAAKLSA